MTRLLAKVGAHPAGLWIIKHVVSRLDRLVVGGFGGRVPPPSRAFVPSLLLTVVGRRSGVPHTTPLVYVRDDAGYIVANARPEGERRNPWVANLRAAGGAEITVGRRRLAVSAHKLGEEECERWWPALTAVWPAFAAAYAATGERTVFSLRPLEHHDHCP